MKTEDLTALGLNQEQINAIFALNGKDLAASQKALADMTAERDALNGKLTTATDALKKFENVDVEAIRKQAADAQKALDAATAKYQADLTARDQSAWIDAKFDALGVKSPFARKQIKAELQSGSAGPAWKDGAYLGFDEYMANAKKLDPSLYQTAEEKKAADAAAQATPAKPDANLPVFTAPAGQAAPEKKYIPPKIL